MLRSEQQTCQGLIHNYSGLLSEFNSARRSPNTISSTSLNQLRDGGWVLSKPGFSLGKHHSLVQISFPVLRLELRSVNYYLSWLVHIWPCYFFTCLSPLRSWYKRSEFGLRAAIFFSGASRSLPTNICLDLLSLSDQPPPCPAPSVASSPYAPQLCSP